MRLVFHPVGLGYYYAGDAPLELVKHGNLWRIEAVNEVEEPEAQAWLERNQTMFEGDFPRMRDARQVLETVFEMDPPPTYDMIPASWLRKHKNGYRLDIPDGPTLHVQRSKALLSEWELWYEGKNGMIALADFATLWEVRAHRRDILRLVRQATAR